MSYHSIAHSVPSTDSISALVASTYNLRPITQCRLLQRGFNDSYAVTTGTGERFVLRISLAHHRLREEADVASETAFLAYLDSANVPVAVAVPTKEGSLFTTATLPDGPCPVVLFRYVEGRSPDLDAPEEARMQGITLAHLHLAADVYPGREDGRNGLDLDHLLQRPIQAILGLDLGASQLRHDLTMLETRLANTVADLNADLALTRCHGDVHGLNARIAGDQAVFFDFDEGGFGYLAYDLAAHLWAQVSFGRRRHAIWRAFDPGYRSIRPLKPVDEAAVPVFVAPSGISGSLASWPPARLGLARRTCPFHGWKTISRSCSTGSGINWRGGCCNSRCDRRGSPAGA